jgi:hypothetical protein
MPIRRPTVGIRKGNISVGDRYISGKEANIPGIFSR